MRARWMSGLLLLSSVASCAHHAPPRSVAAIPDCSSAGSACGPVLPPARPPTHSDPGSGFQIELPPCSQVPVPKPPAYSRATRQEPRFVRDSVGAVLVSVFLGPTRGGDRTAVLWQRAGYPEVVATADSLGQALLVSTPGTGWLRLRRLGYGPWQDSLALRLGSLDTLVVELRSACAR